MIAPIEQTKCEIVPDPVEEIIPMPMRTRKPYVMTEKRKATLEKANQQRKSNQDYRKNLAQQYEIMTSELQKTYEENLKKIREAPLLTKIPILDMPTTEVKSIPVVPTTVESEPVDKVEPKEKRIKKKVVIKEPEPSSEEESESETEEVSESESEEEVVYVKSKRRPAKQVEVVKQKTVVKRKREPEIEYEYEDRRKPVRSKSLPVYRMPFTPHRSNSGIF